MSKPGVERHHVNVSLSADLDEQLTARARAIGLSRGMCVRRVLEAFFARAAPSPGRAWELDANQEEDDEHPG